MTRQAISRGIALLLLATAAGCQRTDRVIVTEKTKVFHMKECPRVIMARTAEMTVARAESLGCTPCPECLAGEAR